MSDKSLYRPVTNYVCMSKKATIYGLILIQRKYLNILIIQCKNVEQEWLLISKAWVFKQDFLKYLALNYQS